MKVAAIIIDDRVKVADKAIKEHKKYLPIEWPILHFKAPYYDGINSLKSASDYNKVLTNPLFWKFLEFDRVLVFQHDSGLLREGIEEFLKWGFIGAWIDHIPGCMNGGLSIRNPKLMYEISKKIPYRGMAMHGNEDIYFCNQMRKFGVLMPDKETCNKFAVETEFALGSVGYHAINKYHKNYKLIINQYESS